MDDPHLHLLIDDDEIDARWNLTRSIARPDARTYDPIMGPDRPWEGEAAGLWASILYDAELRQYRMWYRSFDYRRPHADQNFLNYAVSQDGLAWEKPNLGLIEFEGSRDTNLFYRPDDLPGLRAMESHGVIVDEIGAPERRYKLPAYHAFEGNQGNGIFALFSPDGLRWTRTQQPILPGAGDRHAALRDDATGEYSIYTRRPRHRVGAPPPEIDGAAEALPYKRVIARTTSRDFLHWSDFQTVLTNDEFDTRGTEFYSISPFRYGNRVVAFVDLYDTEVEKMWVTLASSLDGVHWNRPLRTVRALDLGAEGRWDDTWINVTNNPPVREGRNLRFWYMGRDTAHGLPYRRGAMGSFLLGLDRFVALSAGQVTGRLVTDVVEAGGSRLFLNAALKNGHARVELRTVLGGPVPGRSLADCDEIRGDEIDHPVSWRGESDLGPLRGQPVRLQIDATYGQLYAYRFGDAPRDLS